MTVADSHQSKMGLAAAAHGAGRAAEAKRLLEEILASSPAYGPALNSLGLIALGEGNLPAAVNLLERAAAADPKAAPVWLNLAEAHRAAQDPAEQIKALDQALAIDPYLVPALLRKAQALELLGSLGESAKLYKALLAVCPNDETISPALRDAITHGQALIDSQSELAMQAMLGPLEGVAKRFPDADMHRAHAYAEHLAGRRKVYSQQPVGGHFPYLPALEFFPRDCFPWLAELERHTPAIREELLSLWASDDPNFRPYVAYPPGTPVNQWTELNHSPRWSAWFFWENGVRNDSHCERCPRTAEVLEQLPLLDLPGKGPTAMFSILKPRTRIPPHTGSTNIRTTVHLPLVVPSGCRFRVGAQMREWQEGQAWAFDDTIEHEAWNDSESPRAILIVDCWNPLLTEPERHAVRAVTRPARGDRPPPFAL